MTHLFPPIRVEVDGAVDPQTGEITASRPNVWEPAVGLVAEARAALEGSGDAAHGDRWPRMQLREWIQTRWLESFQIVLGTADVKELPKRPATEVTLEQHLRTPPCAGR